MNDRGLVQTANVLRERGVGVVRFNFLYSRLQSGLRRNLGCAICAISLGQADRAKAANLDLAKRILTTACFELAFGDGAIGLQRFVLESWHDRWGEVNHD